MTDPKAVETKQPQNVVAVIANTLRAADLQSVLKTHLPPDVGLDKFTSATIEAIKRKPDLFEDADRASLYNAVVEAARDGLVPDGKQGALVPFSTKVGQNWIKKVQFLIMPEGIIAKLAKLGITCYAVSVYANDEISIWYDDEGQHVKHEPVVFGERGERVGAYACARTKTGTTFIEAMNMEDLDVPRRATKSKDTKTGEIYGPWRDVPDRMEQKSCLHRLCKRVPGVEIGDDPEFRDTEPGPGITVLPRDKPAPLARPRALQAVVDTAATPIDQPVPDPPASEVL
jgi:recombination protein RecT